MAKSPYKRGSISYFFNRLVERHFSSVLFILIGLILVGFGAFIAKDNDYVPQNKIEVLEDNSESETQKEIVVEIAGAIESPGVYVFQKNARIEDLLIKSGGLSAAADRIWIEKFLNRASKLVDGQKVFIPRVGEENEVLGITENGGDQNVSRDWGSGAEKLININTASQKELETLWGIGPVYAQNIIEHRPYSSVEELKTNNVIKQNVYDRNKDLLTVY